jgi:hypothetical protein
LAAGRLISEPFVEAACPGIVVFDAERGDGQAAATHPLLAGADEQRRDAQALHRTHHGQLREDAGAGFAGVVDSHLGDRLAAGCPHHEVVLQALGRPLQGGGDAAQVRRVARPSQAGQIAGTQVADGQLPDAANQDHLPQALERSPVKPHDRILRGARRQCNSLTGSRRRP